MADAIMGDRAFLAVSGEDAESFLQGLVTADLASLGESQARLAALLTPQGKIQFEFLVARHDGGFILETASDQIPAFEKRLILYRLRAKVSFQRLPETAVALSWGEAGGDGVADERFAKAGIALSRKPVTAPESGRDGFEALRIKAGIAEAGRDFPLADAFPHDALYDLNGGVSFRKGCYVGQEVVSRMHHRSTARRRIVIIEATAPLPAPGTPLTAGGRDIGQIGSALGTAGLAMARIDKIGAALERGETILAGEVPVTCRLPDWTGLAFPSAAEEADG